MDLIVKFCYILCMNCEFRQNFVNFDFDHLAALDRANLPRRGPLTEHSVIGGLFGHFNADFWPRWNWKKLERHSDSSGQAKPCQAGPLRAQQGALTAVQQRYN